MFYRHSSEASDGIAKRWSLEKKSLPPHFGKPSVSPSTLPAIKKGKNIFYCFVVVGSGSSVSLEYGVRIHVKKPNERQVQVRLSLEQHPSSGGILLGVQLSRPV